ncbi:exporter of polyketide antibiotics [Fodinibacter luteus]|uniref:Exporter of polyketide antibiotics n=1 Tax=Fodinibacter luteus TaxID=552064 RepID=A0ABP8KKQ8_9MICO
MTAHGTRIVSGTKPAPGRHAAAHRTRAPEGRTPRPALLGDRTGGSHGSPRHPYAGSRRLLRLALREDRLRIVLWTVGLTSMALFTAPSVESAYGGAEGMEARAAVAGNPAAVLINGPTFAPDNDTLGSMIASELGMMTFLAVGVMSILLVVRHTRAEEDSGRSDLVRALGNGRFAPAVAALGSMTVANLAVATGMFLGLQGHGLPGVDLVAFSLSIAAAGVVFGALAAVTAQVADHARPASAMALTVLGLSYVLRGIGDARDPVDGSWLSWVSPLAWLQQMRPWVELRWWPLALTLAAAVGLVGLASVLGARRDLGAGLVPSRAGRSTARPWLSSPAGLAAHELRGDLIAWGAGLAAFAILFGALTTTMEQALADVPMMQDWMALDPGAVRDSLLAAMISYFTVGTAAFAVSATLHLHHEEDAGTAAVAVVDGPGRLRWLLSWVAVVAAATVVVQVLGGLGLGIGFGIDTGDWSGALDLVVHSLVGVPAVLVFVGVVVALFGLVPRLVMLAWALVSWALFAMIFGMLLELPEWAMSLSPIEASPRVPYEDLAVTPLIVLLGITLVLGVAGTLGFLRRDIDQR